MTEVVDVLVTAGARIGSLEMAAAAGDISGWPLARFTPQARIRALVFAADHQRLEVIDQLAGAGAPVSEPDAEWGRLPLHTAAASGRPGSIRRLLAHGADPDQRDPIHHRTPLEECGPPNRPPASPGPRRGRGHPGPGNRAAGGPAARPGRGRPADPHRGARPADPHRGVRPARP
ncbi:MAG: ankyrin repeat domain-containing protein [Streptosporangiaceae bacterium]